MESFGEVLCRLHHACLAGCAYERDTLRGKFLVSAIKGHPGMDHLSLTEDSQLISTERIGEVGEKRVFPGELLDVILELLNRTAIYFRL